MRTTVRDSLHILSQRVRSIPLWAYGLLALGLLIHIPFSIPYILSPQPVIDRDSALFQYIGWQLTHGGIPYLTVLDIKPPLIYYSAAGLSLLSDGDPLTLHRLSILSMIGIQLIIPLSVGGIVYKLRQASWGAFVSGALVFAVSASYQTGAHGLRPKPVMISLGLLGIYSVLSDRYYLAGLFTALSAGFYQIGGAFFLTAIWIAARSQWSADGGRPAVTVAGMGVLTGTLAIFPNLVTGTGGNLLINTVVYHAIISNKIGFIDRLIELRALLGPALAVAIVGSVGVFRGGLTEYSNRWLLILWVLTGLQPFYLDLSGGLDIFAWYTVVCIGAGLVFADANTRLSADRTRLAFAACTVGVIFVVIATGLPTYTGMQTRYNNPADYSDLDEYVINDLYLEQQQPRWCRVIAANQYNKVQAVVLDSLGGNHFCRKITIREVVGAGIRMI